MPPRPGADRTRPAPFDASTVAVSSLPLPSVYRPGTARGIRGAGRPAPSAAPPAGTPAGRAAPRLGRVPEERVPPGAGRPGQVPEEARLGSDRHLLAPGGLARGLLLLL